MWCIKWHKTKFKILGQESNFIGLHQKYGVAVNTYHTDNVIFNFENFRQELLKSEHETEFIATVSPHQNGVVEREIKIVVNMVNTMVLHSALRLLALTTKPKPNSGYTTTCKIPILDWNLLKCGMIPDSNLMVRVCHILVSGDVQTM